jgi:hypothetical protein
MSKEPLLTEQIAARLKEYMLDPEHDALNLRQLAARFEALPLCVDWEKCWALRPDGQVVVFPHEDENPQMRHEDNSRMVNVALYQGSLTYPEIKHLVPDRPVDAQDCPFCPGESLQTQNADHPTMICYCGGLGWVPREMQRS